MISYGASGVSGKTACPLTLRISVTDRCQLRCRYCMPPEGIPKKSHREILTFEEIVRFVRAMKSRFGVAKVRITGGEPLIRSGIVDLIASLAREGIEDLAMTTNGQHLAEVARELKRAGLRRVNISLDSLDEKTYHRLTGGGKLQQSLAGIAAAIEHDLTPVKINTVVLRGINDHEVNALARFGLEHGCRVRFLELMPIGCAKSMFGDLFVPTSEVRSRLEQAFVLKPLDSEEGQSSRNFQATDNEGRSGIIGFISSETQPFCQDCKRMRLTSTGQLIPCLARGAGPNVRHLLKDGGQDSASALQEIVAAAMAQKCFRSGFETQRPMVTVGG